MTDILCFLNEYASAIQAVAAALAVMVGGYWTLLASRKQRLHYPRLDVEIPHPFVFNAEGFQFIHAEVRLINRGSVIFKSRRAELRLRQVLPLPDTIKDKVRDCMSKSYDPVGPDSCELEWPAISVRNWPTLGKIEVEPAETDTLHADFVVSTTQYEVVELYFFLENPKKKGPGWTVTRIVVLEQEIDDAAEDHEYPRKPDNTVAADATSNSGSRAETTVSTKPTKLAAGSAS